MVIPPIITPATPIPIASNKKFFRSAMMSDIFWQLIIVHHLTIRVVLFSNPLKFNYM